MSKRVYNSPTVSRLACNRTLVSTVISFAAITIAASVAIPTVYVAALLISTVVVLGSVPIAIGGAAGVIIHDLFSGSVGYWTAVVSLWIFTFAGVIAWLSPNPIRNRVDNRAPLGIILAYIGIATPAGIYATSAAAWLSVALSGEPLYTAVTTLVFGVAITIGVGTVILSAYVLRERWNALASTDRRTGTGSETDGGIHQLFDSKTVTLVGHFVLGTVWLLGTIGLDIAVRDLGLFATESQLVESLGFGGGGSILGSTIMIVLTGIYRYGDVGILLSAPIAIVVIAAYTQYRTGSLIVKEASA